ncbi:site-specific integrase [Microbacterium sp. NPDC097977]|uniref:tyrosine-type recombinase/integrase n=1 Tax=Microbacterium sp. NPDC097977 TaxID=3155686 RepID=UPI00331F4BA2
MTVSRIVNADGSISYRARVKSGRSVVASKTFRRKGDADTWHDSQKRALSLGEFVDPRAGMESVGSALERWAQARAGTVASKTLDTEKHALKHVPTALRNRPLSAVRATDLEALYTQMMRTLNRSTVIRFRQVISPFFSWAVAQKLIAKNPAIESKVPRGTGQDTKREIFPYTVEELRAVHADLLSHTSRENADIALVLGLTGIRWGELAALRVRDVQELPYPALRISRSKPDGQPVRTVTKGGKPRTVPLMGDVATIVLNAIKGKAPDALVFASATGSARSGNNWKRDAHWKANARGRRVHDLRHTAASLWLINRVDIKTVQTWLGHSSAKLTMDLYGHYMGNDADTAAVARMNAVLAQPGDAGGTLEKLSTGAER